MPLIQVTYNGDFFDWPFVDQRCQHYGINMYQETGFRVDNAGEYKSRYAPHMDAFRWVKRDSYLPVGSQGLKAVTKAKLRYDPVEIHYEEMCKMAAEQPQELCNYSVSDAVATYYLYMKYVHPFIYALCTIIPLGPDDVLRKGSGTLCEALLMYNAFHGNIVMPNKTEAKYNQFYNSHLIDTETYIGGHVEALESGVFRNDIPCRFRVVPEAMQGLIDGLDDALKYAITVEEGRDFSTITNYEEERDKVKRELEKIRDEPYRVEKPLIYHLDVAAMYPNIILTNRLQPMAMVDEATCAACEFNKPDSRCQRVMDWSWRGDIVPASRGEFEMVKLQLESEKFPPHIDDPQDGPLRSFHELGKEESANTIKKRLKSYSQKVYKKSKETIVEEKKSTICQRENPFYIETVENFRDRRYVYKGKLKDSKKELSEIEELGDPVETKRVASLVVLYDSLQLAHKCILNSFYGYVMRKGARWYSLEMAGIVCLTGANIITKAREIVEQIGRPLELDTDGIWCILPGSFPENIVFKTSEPGKKSKCVVSYPGAMLNVMVKDHFTNDQYQQLEDKSTLQYKVSTVNSIFFEVDGPYKAMILPAAREAGKTIKKRYAVYDLDGSLAELKGFEIKRNGELKLIKVFQAGVFDSFLLGNNLQDIYNATADCANHWLDILYARGGDLTDAEVFDLIQENRSMSRALSDYGEQKSTSIKTAKRLAEFLGDDMVKDKGLACSFIISKKPEGAPVTDRAIPVAIFQAEEAVKKHFLRRWLKTGRGDVSFNIRDILDWGYYIERLGAAIQKIITIPAAHQDVANPVPRVPHPDWLQKQLLDKVDPLKQKKITSMFKAGKKPVSDMAIEAGGMPDFEDQFAGPKTSAVIAKRSGGRVTKHQKKTKNGGKGIHFSRKAQQMTEAGGVIAEDAGDWRQILGPHPKRSDPGWLAYSKRKWRIQRAVRRARAELGIVDAPVQSNGKGMQNFFAQQTNTINRKHWEIIQIAPTEEPGAMRVWALVNNDLHCLRLNVYRRFFVNMQSDDVPPGASRKVNRGLPRAHTCMNLFEFNLKEREFMERQKAFSSYFTHPDVEGVYETQVPLMWRAIVEIGCVCTVHTDAARRRGTTREPFTLPDLTFKTTAECEYLSDDTLKRVYLHHNASGNRAMFGLFFPEQLQAQIFVVDPGRNEAMPNLSRVWREVYQNTCENGYAAPPENYKFESQVFRTVQAAAKPIHQALLAYNEQRHGPTAIFLQSPTLLSTLQTLIPSLPEFPVLASPVNSKDNNYPALDWQRYAASRLLNSNALGEHIYQQRLASARYGHVPVGNLPTDTPVFLCDVFLARALKRQNHLLWVSSGNRPDLGGREEDDNRLMTDMNEDMGLEINEPGRYSSVCVQFNLENLAVNAVLQSNHINDAEGASGDGISFDSMAHTSLDDIVGTGFKSTLTSFDESAQCTPVFRVLKSLVHTWLHETVQFENELADSQLVSFYRWLRSSGASLYDPALYRMVRNMMKKLFMQLIAEFRRLGADIVFASFNKVIIDTKKSSSVDGRKYVDYVLGCIKAKPLFGTMTLEPDKYWEQLVWMDRSNYGGIAEFELPRKDVRHGADLQKRRRIVEDSDSDEAPDENQDDEDALASQLGTHPNIEVDMHWNINTYLPEAICQPAFQTIVADWLYRDTEAQMRKRVARGGAGMTPVRAPRDGKKVPASQMEGGVVPVRKELFKNTSDSMMLHVKAIEKQLPGDSAVEHSNEFPKLAGSHLTMNNPALEFIKFVTNVLALDETTKVETAHLRKQLLKLVKVREFSKEAQFEDPSLSLDLIEVVCSFCSHSHELDLIRDQKLAEGLWLCEHCENHHDVNEIEQGLIEYVQRHSMAFQLQDLVCQKCHMVKEDNLSTYCACSGEYKLTMTLKEFEQNMGTLKKVAEFHALERLLEELEWMTATMA